MHLVIRTWHRIYDLRQRKSRWFPTPWGATVLAEHGHASIADAQAHGRSYIQLDRHNIGEWVDYHALPNGYTLRTRTPGVSQTLQAVTLEEGEREED